VSGIAFLPWGCDEVRACVRLPGSGRLRMGVVGGREVGMEIGLWAGWMGWDGMWGTLCGG